MKHFLLSIILITGWFSMQADEDLMFLHLKNKSSLGAEVNAVDSLYFTENNSLLNLRIGENSFSYAVSDVDSITFGPYSETIQIVYEGETARLVNPLAFQGVEVQTEGGFVTVNATTETRDINYNLKGQTDNGTFKIYSEKRYNVILDGVSITNPEGPAINAQSKKKITIMLANGTINTLSDGELYAESPNEEDQKGALFSEASMVFEGEGSLVVNGIGLEKHAICSDDDIEINGGIITVSSANKDGIHGQDGVRIYGGDITISASSDGIDADNGPLEIFDGLLAVTLNEEGSDGLCSNDSILIAGGTIHINMNGNESKGIKNKAPLILSAGDISIITTGDAVLKPSGSGYSPSYCTAIKSLDNIYLNGANITIQSSGLAGKGISSDADVIISAGDISITTTGNGAVYTDEQGKLSSYKANCISTDNDLYILGGTLTTHSSGTAGRGIVPDNDLIIGDDESSPTVSITTTGDKLYISGSWYNAKYAEAKAIKAKNNITINGGDITISSSDDGLKALNEININDGTLNILNSYEGIEAPFITFNGGVTHIKSSDDCLNSTFGLGGEANDGSLLTINAGYIVTNSTGGDGIDSNGDVLITGGELIIHGPPYMPEVGLDFNGHCNVHGGFMIISAPNSFLIQTPDLTSEQNSLKVTSGQTLSSSTLFHLQHSSGAEIVTFKPIRNYSSIIFSSEDLQSGETYSVYTGGSSTGTEIDGVYHGGEYSGGTLRKTFTVIGKVTSVSF